MFGIISVLLLKHFIAVLWCWCPINTILTISRHLFKFRVTGMKTKIWIILYRIYSIVGITSEAFIFNTKKSNLKKKKTYKAQKCERMSEAYVQEILERALCALWTRWVMWRSRASDYSGDQSTENCADLIHTEKRKKKFPPLRFTSSSNRSLKIRSVISVEWISSLGGRAFL